MRTLQLSFKTSQLESEEEHKARLAKERAAQGKTLFEQLAENKEKAQQDYDAVTKQIFGRGRVNISYHVWRDYDVDCGLDLLPSYRSTAQGTR